MASKLMEMNRRSVNISTATSTTSTNSLSLSSDHIARLAASSPIYASSSSSSAPSSSSSDVFQNSNGLVIDPELGLTKEKTVHLKSLGGSSTSTSSSLSGTNNYTTGLLVLLWYASAVFAISTSKIILNETGAPLLLCLVQFCSSTALTYLLSTNQIPFISTAVLSLPPSSKASPTSTSSSSSLLLGSSSSLTPSRSNIMPKLPHSKMFIHMTAISYTLGFIFTNLSFNLVNANFAETIKAAEPLSSVLIAYFFLNEVTSIASYLTLIPICAGVAVACLNDVSFDPYGFIFAAISNICFSCRAVFAKKVNQLDKAMDENSLFYHISIAGLYIIVPLYVVFEMKHTISYFSNIISDKGILGPSYILSIFIVNGLTYTCYNLVSYYVLSRVNLITHAVLNVFRRVVIIASTAVFFGITLSNLNKLGVAVALLGVVFFTAFKRLQI